MLGSDALGASAVVSGAVSDAVAVAAEARLLAPRFGGVFAFVALPVRGDYIM